MSPSATLILIIIAFWAGLMLAAAGLLAGQGV
jgi:hypothetical protein